MKSKNKIVALNNSYHGETFGAMSASDRSIFTLAFHDLLLEVIFLEFARRIAKNHLENIACFI